MNNEIRQLEMRIKLGSGDEELDLVQCAALRDLMNAYESQITTLSAERDEARKEVEALKADDKSNTAMSDRCNRVMRVLRDSGNADAESAFWIIAGDARDSRETIARLTAELAALKAAPGMEEVDVLVYWPDHEFKSQQYPKIQQLADLARRSIVSRNEAVELLKWFRGWVNNDRFMDEVYEGTEPAIRINEIARKSK